MSDQQSMTGGAPGPANSDRSGQPVRVLPGLLALVELIESLVHRSGRREWRIPLLCLVTRPGTPSPLAVVAKRFNTGDRQVPHVRVSAKAGDLRALLHHAYEGLSARRFGAPPLRFRHFALAEWLMSVDLKKVPVAKRQRELARRLGRNFGLPGNQDAYGVAQAVGGLLGFMLWVAAFVLPMMLLRPFVTGRMRWFMRQQYLAPKLSGSFFAFAVRLTGDARDAEDRSQLDRLLVHAFLQDLRAAYRRRIWRLTAWRRTAYPVLLLDDIELTNAGYELLSVVSAVRNETGRSDPLLIITSGQDAPPYGLPVQEAPEGWVVPLDGVQGAYRAWYDNIPAARRARDETAWYLPVEIPPADLDALQARLPRIAPPPLPLLARPLVLIGLVVAGLLGSGIWYGPQLRDAYVAYQHACYPVNPPGRVNVVWTDQQCIGYSDNDGQYFGQSAWLVDIQKKIFKQNRDAEASWAARGNRPYVTLVFLATLTRPDPKANQDDETYVAEGEGLQGMLAAQYRANLEADNDSASPYLRIIVANAGQEAQHADQVVDMLKGLVDHDHTVIGVVASVDSRKRPQIALRTLDAIGLPAITPTTSADHIGDGSNSYLQIAPPNNDQAQLVHHYVTQVLHRQDVFNYYTYGVKGIANQGDDLYVDTLRDRLRSTFAEHYQDKFWKNGVKVTDLCADTFNGVIFFGGRYSEFGAFVSQVYSDCSGRLPILISDDSTSRYMANHSARQGAPTTLPLIFASKGALSSCNLLAAAGQSERRNFLSDISTGLSYCRSDSQTTGDLAGGWIGLTYDATRIMVRAVKDIAGNRPQIGTGQRWDPAQINPQMVYQQARQWNKTHPYQAVTGPIQFDPNGVPIDKYLSLLCAPNIQTAYRTNDDLPYEVDSIGTGYNDQQPPRKPCTAAT
jgi:hypothetical protein